MRITITRTGGFAGLDQTLASVDTGRLPKDSGEKLRQHIARLSALIGQTPLPEGKDYLCYTIVVTEAGSPPASFSVLDEGDPDSPLMKELTAILEESVSGG